jgi:site-specific recombinase XerD
MFEQIYKSSLAIARHERAPYAQERSGYLEYCQQRGESPSTVIAKASDLLWIAHKLSVYPDLQMTIEQIRAAVVDEQSDDGEAGHRKLDSPHTHKRLTDTARSWLRYLGCLLVPVEEVPFESRLDDYCAWAKDERGLSAATIYSFRHRIKQFLLWYGALGRALSAIQITDCDAYLAFGRQQGWCRVSVRNVVDALRAFFRYGAEQGWCPAHLSQAIHPPRIYALEALPAGPAWADVQQLFSTLDPSRPRDIRARAILMLFAVYGMRVSEVARLRLDDIDWQHDQLRVPRAKRREPQVYPLVPSVGNAILQYLQSVRHGSAHREVFLTLISPYRPLSTGGLFNVVSARLKSLDLPCAHHGPHALRHACACRLLAEGLSLKEIGDHLGHRSTAATRVYAKVDLLGLREVAAFDLGELS